MTGPRITFDADRAESQHIVAGEDPDTGACIVAFVPEGVAEDRIRELTADVQSELEHSRRVLG